MKNRTLTFHSIQTKGSIKVPLMADALKAGFPSPAEDYLEGTIDLNEALISNPAATFCARVSGNSMQEEGIVEGDVLVIDRSLDPKTNDIAVCFVDGEFTVKKIKIEKDHCWLIPANKAFDPIKVTEDNEFIIWGVVSYVIKKSRR